MSRQLAVVPIVLSLISLGLAGCDKPALDSTAKGAETGRAESAPTVHLYEVKGEPFVETIDLPGASVYGMETVEVMAKVPGYVGRIGHVDGEEIDIGSKVKKGDLLAVIDVPEMADEIDQQAAQLDLAESEKKQAVAALKEKEVFLQLRYKEYTRVKSLVDEQAIKAELLDEAVFKRDAAKAQRVRAEADLGRAQAQIKVAAAALNRLRTMAQYTQIKAPFDGVITGRMVHHGAFVRPASNSAATPMFVLTRDDRVRIVAQVPMRHAPKIRRHQKAVFHGIGGLPDVRIEADVTRTNVMLDQNTRMLRIELHLDTTARDDKSGQPIVLQPGMFGVVTVTLRQWDELPRVPSPSVLTSDDGSAYVMVVDQNNLCHRRAVQIAFDDAIHVGVDRGLKVGERIVRLGAEDLKDGQKVVTVK